MIPVLVDLSRSCRFSCVIIVFNCFIRQCHEWSLYWFGFLPTYLLCTATSEHVGGINRPCVLLWWEVDTDVGEWQCNIINSDNQGVWNHIHTSRTTCHCRVNSTHIAITAQYAANFWRRSQFTTLSIIRKQQFTRKAVWCYWGLYAADYDAQIRLLLGKCDWNWKALPTVCLILDNCKRLKKTCTKNWQF